MKHRRAIVAIVGALTALAPLAIDFYLPGLPHLTADLGADASTGQLTITACLLGIAVSQVFAGSLGDSLGRRGLVIFGLAAFTAISALCALAPSIWVLIGLRLAQGAAVGVGVVLARAVVRDLYSGTAAARIFARLVLISGIAPVLAPLLGAEALQLTDWRGIFVVLCGAGALLLALAVAWLPETLAEHLRHEPGVGAKLRVYRRLIGDRRFLPFAASGSLAFAAMFAYIAGSPFVLENVYGLSPLAFGVVFAANATGIVVFAQVSDRLVERTGERRLLAAGVATTACGGAALLAVTLLDAGLAPFVACLVVTISAIGLVLPNATALAMAHQPHAAGSASALFGLGQFGVGALAAPLVGLAGSHNALPMALTIAACGLGALAIDRTLTPG